MRDHQLSLLRFLDEWLLPLDSSPSVKFRITWLLPFVSWLRVPLSQFFLLHLSPSSAASSEWVVSSLILFWTSDSSLISPENSQSEWENYWTQEDHFPSCTLFVQVCIAATVDSCVCLLFSCLLIFTLKKRRTAKKEHRSRKRPGERAVSIISSSPHFFPRNSFSVWLSWGEDLISEWAAPAHHPHLLLNPSSSRPPHHLYFL